jgi:hypothetical protein
MRQERRIMDPFKCAGCGAKPPEEESAYTLIGGKSGWRLMRRREDDGTLVSEWRCPQCWIAYKKASAPSKGAAVMPAPASKRSSILPGGGKRD